MKTLADNSFFLVFEEVIRRDNQNRASDCWSAAGVTWRHSKHSFESEKYGFAMDAYEAIRPGKTGWTLLVVKEHWWAGKHGDVLRSTQWAKPLAGNRRAIFDWFKLRQKEFGL